MRAITLWQPWASLIFAGWKKYETRSRATFCRGPLAIHAALRQPPHIDGDPLELVQDEWGGHWAMDLPRGKVLGVVNLTECRGVEQYDVDAPERLCGDWKPGRFAWRLDNPQSLLTPIAATGGRRFWDWPVPPDAARYLATLAAQPPATGSETTADLSRQAEPDHHLSSHTTKDEALRGMTGKS